MKYFFFVFFLCIKTNEQPDYYEDIQQDILEQNKLNQYLDEERSKARKQIFNDQDKFIVVDGDQLTNMQDLKRIAEISNETEQVYTDCINEIPDNNFDTEQIQNCIGTESVFIINDFDYLIRTINSYYENAIRQFILKNCYLQAGNDFVLENGCKVYEKDVLDLLWQEMNVDSMIEINKIKYTFEIAHVTQELYEIMTGYLQTIMPHYYDMLDETYNHRDLTIVRIQKLIEDKTRVIMQEGEEGGFGIKPTIYTHKVSVVQSLNDHAEQENTVEKEQVDPEDLEYETNGPIITIPDVSQETTI